MTAGCQFTRTKVAKIAIGTSAENRSAHSRRIISLTLSVTLSRALTRPSLEHLSATISPQQTMVIGIQLTTLIEPVVLLAEQVATPQRPQVLPCIQKERPPRTLLSTSRKCGSWTTRPTNILTARLSILTTITHSWMIIIRLMLTMTQTALSMSTARLTIRDASRTMVASSARLIKTPLQRLRSATIASITQCPNMTSTPTSPVKL